MDQVDKMKLTKYGFGFNLLGASSILSVLGIVVSIIGVIGSIACFIIGSMFDVLVTVILYVTGAILLILIIPYLAMWILLKIRTSKKNIPGIECIGKVYSYLSGSLEIIASIAEIISAASTAALYKTLFDPTDETADFIETRDLLICQQYIYIIGAAIYLIFACLKIHGVRVENNKLIGIYLGFRYVISALSALGFIILSVLTGFDWTAIITLITGVLYFFLDIGLTVILHSIRVDRENTNGTETP